MNVYISPDLLDSRAHVVSQRGKELKEDPELMEVTVFRPLHDNNKKKSKFDRYTEQSSFESQESFD